MPRPAKTVEIIKLEKKSHRTKKELAVRKQGEEALLSKKSMKMRLEVKNSPIAKKEFTRINNLYKAMNKNDAIYESALNRYCIIYAECIDLENKKNKLDSELEELQADKEKLLENNNMYLSEYYDLKNKIRNSFIALDRQLQSKRKMLLDLEKELAMTIAAAVRIIPKTPEKQENPLSRIMQQVHENVYQNVFPKMT